MSTEIVRKTSRLLFVLLLSPQMISRAEWALQQSHTTNPSFQAVHAVSAKVVWVAGSGSACLRILDAEHTWEKIIAGPWVEKVS